MVKVYDGDTVTVLLGGRRERVRLIGIDCPELRQRPWGKRARDFLRRLVLHRTVRLELDVDPWDRYGRLLAYVWLDGELVNETLVREGLCLIYTVPPNVKHAERFREAQRWAREHGRGFWAEGGLSETPYQWRRRHRRH
ncbi:thermonuclease family protein [Thermosulfurimonas dismutans]|uniref:Thermonuclease n=1 Tax=Thermosulfurimonas dismutans TaxID=999894 RepID=A0A179D5F5_9BACT|nr:thermonuclease family protein [Thermosulfurimonas dismutans]OAQ21021.1 Thermonuclease [Thermosulfurimonas dismutans]